MAQIVNLQEYRRLKTAIAKHVYAYASCPTKQNKYLIMGLASLAELDFGVKKMNFSDDLQVINGRVVGVRKTQYAATRRPDNVG